LIGETVTPHFESTKNQIDFDHPNSWMQSKRQIPSLNRQRSLPCIGVGDQFANPASRRAALGHPAVGDTARGPPRSGYR